MSSRGRFRFGALSSFALIAGISACDGDDAGGGDDAGDDEAGTGGVLVGGATASGGTAGQSGASNDAAGTTSRGGGTATGGTSSNPNAGRSGSMNGTAGRPVPPGGGAGNSPYELECHGDTAMCGNPSALLCLGLRIGTEVLGYSCANECQSDADCSDEPASTDASAGCVDFVNKKYCMLVCKNGDEQASCPSGMSCYVYEGTPTGYCLWR